MRGNDGGDCIIGVIIAVGIAIEVVVGLGLLLLTGFPFFLTGEYVVHESGTHAHVLYVCMSKNVEEQKGQSLLVCYGTGVILRMDGRGA